jgi:uncharacterized damage-inducible protein DinB
MAKRITDTQAREIFTILFERFEVYEQTLGSVVDSVKTVLRDVAQLDHTHAKRFQAEEDVKKLDEIQARLSQHVSYADMVQRLKGD